MDHLLHTPDGVRDIYNEECRRRNYLADRLQKVLNLYGYQDIQTPSFEFFDIFNRERGTVSSRNMYKFFDREGNTLVLRPDITPSIARAVVKYYADEKIPLRFSYCGSTFINNVGLKGRMDETTQIGAELVMDPGIEADAEMIALAVHLLQEAGLSDFQIDIGHVGLFQVLCEEAGLEEEDIQTLKELVNGKNYFGVESFIGGKSLQGEAADCLLQLPEMFGSADVIARAKEMTGSGRALAVLDYLEDLYGLVTLYGFEKYVTIDLGMLSEYNYYTGLILRGYTYGTGDAIIKGGRYDRLIGQFGKDAASVGFVTVLDELMLALERQKIQVPSDTAQSMVLYRAAYHAQAVRTAASLRAIARSVCMIREDASLSMEDYLDYCRRFRIESILHLTGENQIEKIDVADGSRQLMPVPDDTFVREVNEP